MTKRILCMLLCSVFLLSVAVTASAKKISDVIGDANGDGQCTAIDFVMIKRHVLKTYTIGDTFLGNADINRDGRLNTADYVLAKRIVLRTYTPPVQEETLPDKKTEAVLTLSLMLKNSDQEELALLEGIFDISADEMGGIVVKYLATLSADEETLAKWEGSIDISEAELETIALSIKDILLQIQAEQMQ